MCSFTRDTRVDVDPQLSDLPQGDVILAAGVSTRSLSYLAESGLLLQGVMVVGHEYRIRDIYIPSRC